MKQLDFLNVAEDKSVPLRIHKTYTRANLKSHTVLTDDVFTYVDFYFKKNVKRLKDEQGQKLKQSYVFYWQQASNFYQAAKLLPIESAPLPMYYCMLNAAKAYILYRTNDISSATEALKSHGLCEDYGDGDSSELSSIYVRWHHGVFSEFSKMLDPDFSDKWASGKGQVNSNHEPVSVKSLLHSLSFVHSAYISTYGVSRKDEMFLPLEPDEPPAFYYCTDRKIHLIAKLQKSYFKKNATTIPVETMQRISQDFVTSPSNNFCLISKEGFSKTEISKHYEHYRQKFSYISANRRLWYLNKLNNVDDETTNICDLSLIMAIAHRFSEIVRYKPEDMVVLLDGKENWLIHEFLSLALDQFIDGIACEITKQEIMATRNK